MGNPEYIGAQARIGPGAEPWISARSGLRAGSSSTYTPTILKKTRTTLIRSPPAVDLDQFAPLRARITDDVGALCAWAFS